VSNPALVLARPYEGRGWATFTVGLLLLLTVLLAMARARADLALAALVVIGGANLTSRILKYGVLPGLDLRGAPVRRRELVSISIGGALLVWWGVRPQPDLQDLWLGVAALGLIGLACAASVGAVARLADRHLG
jgi:hypothetical protein